MKFDMYIGGVEDKEENQASACSIWHSLKKESHMNCITGRSLGEGPLREALQARLSQDIECMLGINSECCEELELTVYCNESILMYVEVICDSYRSAFINIDVTSARDVDDSYIGLCNDVTTLAHQQLYKE